MTASRLGLLCAIRKNSKDLEKYALDISRTIRMVGKKARGAAGKIKGKKGKIGKGLKGKKGVPTAIEAPAETLASQYPPRIELASGVPEGGPMLPGLAESLGHGVSNLAYNIDPKLQEMLIRLAGGKHNPTTARTLGFLTPAAGIGAMYGLGDSSEPQPSALDMRSALMSGYSPLNIG